MTNGRLILEEDDEGNLHPGQCKGCESLRIRETLETKRKVADCLIYKEFLHGAWLNENGECLARSKRDPGFYDARNKLPRNIRFIPNGISAFKPNANRTYDILIPDINTNGYGK